MEKPIKIQILDNEYLIKSEENDEHVSKIADYVNEKIKEVDESSIGLSDKKTIILAALHIASDYLRLLKEHDTLIANIRQRSKELIFNIDSLLE